MSYLNSLIPMLFINVAYVWPFQHFVFVFVFVFVNVNLSTLWGNYDKELIIPYQLCDETVLRS